MKDYYQIMHVPYDATPKEIRAAYHQLAKKYHPDKNPDNETATLSFVDIQEAYFILSDEERRRNFHLRSKYPFTTQPKAVVETPHSVLSKAKKLNRLLKEIDVYRMNASFYSQAVHLLLSDQNITILTSAVDKSIKGSVISEILQVCRIIPYKEALPVSCKLLLIAGNDEILKKKIYRFTDQKRGQNFWEKYNVVFIILCTLVICLLILILSN